MNKRAEVRAAYEKELSIRADLSQRLENKLSLVVVSLDKVIDSGGREFVQDLKDDARAFFDASDKYYNHLNNDVVEVEAFEKMKMVVDACRLLKGLSGLIMRADKVIKRNSDINAISEGTSEVAKATLDLAIGVLVDFREMIGSEPRELVFTKYYLNNLNSV